MCALAGVDCARLNPCRSTDYICEDPNFICVRHSQCSSQPVCYPLVMMDRRLCPPTSTGASTTFPSTSTSTIFTSTTADSFGGWVHTTYSAELNSLSGRYLPVHFNSSEQGAGHIYHAVTLSVSRQGTYTIRSSSQIDTYGYLYGGQFCQTYLQAADSYILAVTAYRANVTGPFEITASGPSRVDFYPTIVPGLTFNSRTATGQKRNRSNAFFQIHHRIAVVRILSVF